MAIERTVKIDDEILQPLRDLVENFPEPLLKEYKESKVKAAELKTLDERIQYSREYGRCYNLDILTYEKNERILRKVIDANREFFRTDNIPEEQMPEEGTIITVIPDMEVERLIWKAWRLQNMFMEEVLG